VITSVPGMHKHSGHVLDRFGLDQTGRIQYRFNQQGFRSGVDFDFRPDYAFFGASLVFGIGVPEPQTFAAMFPRAHNYGLAGQYQNSDIFDTIIEFTKLPDYSSNTKLVVVWHRRGAQDLNTYYKKLSHVKMLHFFCGIPLSYPNCYAMFPEQDQDVSGTHPGPKTHYTMYKILCNLFDQL